ncbi:MAG: secretin N-terminal domain-containing protein [Bdellovibrionales bacterium]
MRFLAFFALLLVLGCTSNYDRHDRDLALTRDDYKTGMAGNQTAHDVPPPIPAFKPIIAEPDPKPSWAGQRVTLSLDGSVPLKDVLLELAHQAKLDLEMDPSVSGPPMIFTARDQPLGDVLDRLTEPAGLRAVVKKNVLRIEPDTPYVKNYRVDYPNIVRNTGSNISSSLNIAAASESQNNRNDSATSTDSKSETDFWTDLSANLDQMLANDDKKVGSYTINRQAGLIAVRAPQRLHKLVGDYIHRVEEASAAQVLIEARILEVSLTDEFSSGINWSTLTGGAFNFGVMAPLNIPAITADPIPTELAGLSMGISDNNFNGLFNFLETFGTVRALSSPRMTVMQNQVGVIKVVQNEVYFRLTIETTDATATSPQRRDVTSEQRTVPIGLIMNVQPSIDLATNNVTLALRPTITRIAARRTDPSILIAASDAGLTPQQVDSTVPVVSVQEMDSVVSLKSGQTLVMGGLMRDMISGEDQGVPGVSEIPVAGLLAKGREDSTQKSELVVFLKATIVNKARETISPADRDLYRNFGGDRRPINVENDEGDI